MNELNLKNWSKSRIPPDCSRLAVTLNQVSSLYCFNLLGLRARLKQSLEMSNCEQPRCGADTNMSACPARRLKRQSVLWDGHTLVATEFGISKGEQHEKADDNLF